MEPRVFSLCVSLLLILFPLFSHQAQSINAFSIKEATIDDLQLAYHEKKLTSREVVEFYIKEIRRLNRDLKGVIEVNPDALYLADNADRERKVRAPGSLPKMHGIPILVKDNIATKDKLNTTAGSFALLGSVVPRDAGVVAKLRKAGAIILGKSSLSEWSYFRSSKAPSGWSARGGQGKDPYVMGDPCGSSSGSSISVAANLVAVSLGTETSGSILCPSSANSVVGIKPTIGLTSRAGVVPISLRQDTVGPICRTVSDAAHVLDVIVGIDFNDNATIEMSKYIPRGGYLQFLKTGGLRGKRLGVLRDLNDFGNNTFLNQTFEKSLNTLRQEGAVVVDQLQFDNPEAIVNALNQQRKLIYPEFKVYLNSYLKGLVTSPVRSLAEVIAFNKKNAKLEKIEEYGQEAFLEAESTNGIGQEERATMANLARVSKEGFEKVIRKNKLDAVVTRGSIRVLLGGRKKHQGVLISGLLAMGGHPGITVPAGYDSDGGPFGIIFGGLRGFEPKLIEIAYGFEQATKARKPPPPK